MKFRPLHDRVVVRRIDAESKTAGGIIIPDTAKEKPMEGEVIAVGHPVPKHRDVALARVGAMRRANSSRLILRLATRCCSENGLAPRSSSTASNSSS